MRAPFAEAEFRAIDVSLEDDIDTSRVPEAPVSAVVIRRSYAVTLASRTRPESVWPARFCRLSALSCIVALTMHLSWGETALLAAAIVAIVVLHRPVSP